MGNALSSLVTSHERYPAHLNLTQEEVEELHRKEEKMPLEKRRQRYWCGKKFVHPIHIRPWEIDTIRAVYDTIPLIAEQLKDQARAERREELRREHEQAMVKKAREHLQHLCSTDGEYSAHADVILKLTDAHIASVLALADNDIERAARFVAQETVEEKLMFAFEARFRKHFDAMPKHPPIPYPRPNQISSLIHSDFRTPDQAIEVWDQMADLIRRIYDADGVIMPFNQAYKLLRTAGYQVNTAVNYHLKDVRAYRELKPQLLSRYHADNRDDYDAECAHTMLRRTGHSVSEAVDAYGAEQQRRWRAVRELKSELEASGVTHLASDRALYFHMVRCFWDEGLAREQYDYAALKKWEADEAAAKEKKEKKAELSAAGKDEGKSDGKSEESHGKKKKGDKHKDKDVKDTLPAQVLAAVNSLGSDTDKEKALDAAAKAMDILSVPTTKTTDILTTAAGEPDDDDYGIERDIEFAGANDYKSSSEQALEREAERQARVKILLADGERRDEAVLPYGAPFEPQTEINKLVAVLHADPAVVECDAIWVPLSLTADFTPIAEHLIACAGDRLAQELRAVKSWKPGHAVITRAHNLPAKCIVWTVSGSGEQDIANAADVFLQTVKARGWRTVVLTDITECVPLNPPHRTRHIVASRVRVFMDIVSNRRKLDLIIFANASKAVHQCYYRTMLFYFPGPNMRDVVGARFEKCKEEARSVLKDPAFLEELKNMRLEDATRKDGESTVVEEVEEHRRRERKCRLW